MVPDIIHFIYPVTEKTRPWSVVNSLAISKAIDVYKDYEIVIWTNKPHHVPFDENYYSRIKVCSVDLPTHIGGVEIVWPQYVSDVMRLQILLKHGGIYMDTDMISLRQYKPQDDSVLTFCWETPLKESICNAMMITPKDNDFIQAWLNLMPEAMNHPTWAYGGVVLPAELARDSRLRNTRNVLDHTFACPLDLSRQWLFDPALRQEAQERVANAYAIHVFETFWREIIKDITPKWIENNDCLFSELVKMKVD